MSHSLHALYGLYGWLTTVSSIIRGLCASNSHTTATPPLSNCNTTVVDFDHETWHHEGVEKD